jgi:hypothetical protein
MEELLERKNTQDPDSKRSERNRYGAAESMGLLAVCSSHA